MTMTWLVVVILLLACCDSGESQNSDVLVYQWTVNDVTYPSLGHRITSQIIDVKVSEQLKESALRHLHKMLIHVLTSHE